MTSISFQDILGQVQGLNASGCLGSPGKTLRNYPWFLDYEKLNLPNYRTFGEPLSRHHPQGRRVRHIPGLLDIPICAVFDFVPPFATTTAAETLKAEKDGATDGKISDPGAPVKQNSRSSSSNIWRLRDALSDRAGFRSKISRIKQQIGFKPSLSDIQRHAIASPWREELRTLVASLGVLSPQSEDCSAKEPPRARADDRPRTSESIQALGTVSSENLSRPKTSGSGTEKLPPLRGLEPRFTQGSPRPGSFQSYSRPGISSVRTPGLAGVKTEPNQTPIPQGQGHRGPNFGQITVHYSDTAGRLILPPSRATSRFPSSRASLGKRDEARFSSRPPEITQEAVMEGLVLEILCKLLEVNDLNVVRAWLVTAPDSEKAIVLDLLRSVLSERPTNSETRREILGSVRTEHSGTSDGKFAPGPAADAPWSITATGDGWTGQREDGNDVRRTGRVDRLVLDQTQPDMRTNLITTCERRNEGANSKRNGIHQ